MLFLILAFTNIKISYYSNNRKFAATPGDTGEAANGFGGIFGGIL